MLADLAGRRRQRGLQDPGGQLGPDGAGPLIGQDLHLRGSAGGRAGFELFAGYLSAAVDGSGSPLDALPANGRAYLEFSDRYPGHFEIMFRPALINTDDSAYQSAGDKAFQLLGDLVAACQRQGWHPDADTTELTVSTWALFHGLALLRRQGSLAGHLPETTPEAAIQAAQTLTGLSQSRSDGQEQPPRLDH